jgi:hypothetical protein
VLPFGQATGLKRLGAVLVDSPVAPPPRGRRDMSRFLDLLFRRGLMTFSAKRGSAGKPRNYSVTSSKTTPSSRSHILRKRRVLIPTETGFVGSPKMFSGFSTVRIGITTSRKSEGTSSLRSQPQRVRRVASITGETRSAPGCHAGYKVKDLWPGYERRMRAV